MNKKISAIASRYQLSNLSAWQRGEVERAMLAAYRAGVRSRPTPLAVDDFSCMHNHPILAKCTGEGCVRRRASEIATKA